MRLNRDKLHSIRNDTVINITVSNRPGLYFLFDQEYKLQQLQITSRREELESEEAIARMKTNADMKTASYAHDASYGKASITVASILRFVRPVLTFVLLAFVVYIFWQANDDPALVYDLSNQIMFLTTTAVAWWFGDRSFKK